MLSDTEVEEVTMEEVAKKAFEQEPQFPQISLPENHWRYQALHWAYDIKKGQKHSDERYYTRYCPLFHMTNLIAVMFIPILIFKVIRALVMGTIAALSVVGTVMDRTVGVLVRKWIASRAQTRRSKQEEPAEQEMSTKEIRKRQKAAEIRELYVHLRGKDRATFFEDFNNLRYCVRLNHVSTDEMKEIWEEEKDKYERAKVISDARRKKLQAKLVFWVRFSEIFIKGLLNTLYVVLAAAVAYGTYAFGWPIVATVASWIYTLAMWMWNTDYILVGKFILKCISGIVSLGIVGFLGYKLGVPMAKKVAVSALPPVRLVRGVCVAFGTYVRDIVTSVREFWAMYYHNNCPRITVVKEEKAIHATGEDL